MAVLKIRFENLNERPEDWQERTHFRTFEGVDDRETEEVEGSESGYLATESEDMRDGAPSGGLWSRSSG